jgi:hypothetical protein
MKYKYSAIWLILIDWWHSIYLRYLRTNDMMITKHEKYNANMPEAGIEFWTLNSDNNGITKSNISCSILKRWVILGRGRVILRWGLVNLKYSLLQIRLITTQKLCNTGNMGLADWEEKEKIKCRLNLKYYCRLVSQQDQSKTFQSELRDEEYRMTGQGSPSYWFLVFTDTKTLFQLLKLLSLKQENY